jgi:hypothetical protein
VDGRRAAARCQNAFCQFKELNHIVRAQIPALCLAHTALGQHLGQHRTRFVHSKSALSRTDKVSMATAPRNRRRQVFALIGPSKSTFARLIAPCRSRRCFLGSRARMIGADGLNRSRHLDRAESRVVISPREADSGRCEAENGLVRRLTCDQGPQRHQEPCPIFKGGSSVH